MQNIADIMVQGFAAAAAAAAAALETKSPKTARLLFGSKFAATII